MKTLRLLAAILLAAAVVMLPALAEGREGHGSGRGGGGHAIGGHGFSEFRGGGSHGGGHHGHGVPGYRAPVYRGHHGGGVFHGGGHQGAPSYRGGHHGHGAPGYRAPAYRGYHYYPYSRYYGGSVYGRWYWGVPFFAGIGFLSGYWLGEYYYTYPYQGVCRRFVPTGGYHTETQQDPNTGQYYEVQVPDGYWETIPCR